MKDFEIVFENEDVLAVDKRAGLAVQGGAGVGRSLDALLAEQSPRPLLVHRLDRETSGLVITAKSREAAARLSAAFAGTSGGQKMLQKTYIAVCAGRPGAESGSVSLDLAVKGRALPARTFWRVAGGGPLPEQGGPGEYSLLEIEPGTGRMHQIRRHLALQGWPVLGDGKYGDFPLNRALRKSRGLKNLLLHASRLRLSPAVLGYALDLSAPLPPWFGPWAAR